MSKKKEFHSNFIEELEKSLKEKFENYLISTAKPSEILTFNEFCLCFKATTFLHQFNFKGIDFSVVNHGYFSEFWIDGNDSETHLINTSAQDLLDRVMICDKKLNEIWKS